MLRNLKTLDLAAVEEKVLAFWKTNHIFERLLRARRRGRRFNFYEGPPYANGKPGIHHILARVFKDIILRYKSMQGYYVPRRAGWDTHGLPVELEAEKRLGIKNKREIEALGIDVFNKRARDSVFEYKGEWERMTERIGYWLDLKNAYITCEPEYIEGLWRVFKEFDRRGRVKKDTKTIPWCPRCQTPLAAHELGQPGVYTTTSDPSVYVKFRLADEPRTSLLAWTTTPWTLPANALLAVHPESTYQKFQIGDEFVWARELPSGHPFGSAPVAERSTGRELVGARYVPLFSDGGEHPERYVVVSAPFVSAEEGTGIVHIAPAFGAEDHELARSLSFSDFISTINDEGVVLPPHPGAGKWIKDADSDIIADLESRGLVFSRGTIEHEYPHCWRCSTPLIYMSRRSWFLDVGSVRHELVSANDRVNWVPAHIKHGRFGEWIKEGHDWAITRERYWGTPLPFWECGSCGATTVVGSLKEFARLAGPARNTYLVVRHGEADSNALGVISSFPEKHEIKLTEKGRRQIEKLIPPLRKKGIDFVFSSDLFRAKETAEMIGSALGVPVAYDERLREYNL
ncbi:MAG: class I tRNA ligase family protein, partial [Candidatus Colwellbacteria bacterium]|nr:class I tRNA ligase family protein [Candidatus Colwellbacteria bacterium]